jgi:hypothetical protein
MNTAGFINTRSSNRVVMALGAVLLMTGTAAGQDPPSTVDLPVVIRDFSKTHPDFNVIPADGYGYYHGNVALDLDADRKPLFTGGGFRDRSLWKDANGNPIAPHLFNTCGFLTPIGGGGGGAAGFGLAADEKVKVDKHSVIDGFDSSLGPYGDERSAADALVMVNGADRDDEYVKVKDGSTIRGDVMVGPDGDPDEVVEVKKKSRITGTIGQLEAAFEFPDVVPPDLGPSVGKVRYKRREHTISEDLHCRKLKLEKGAVVNIEGDVTIVCDEKLDLDDRSEIRLMPDSTLTLYVGEKLKLDDDSKLNMNTGDPQLVAVYMLSALADDDEPSWAERSRSRTAAGSTWTWPPAAARAVPWCMSPRNATSATRRERSSP